MPTKVVILAGGRGTRISEESALRPKPMVEIGGRPLLWHIMKMYAAHGLNEFIVCAGYKGYLIKEFFANYRHHVSDVTFDLSRDLVTVHHSRAEDWRVTVVDTGLDTMTGGRLRRVQTYLDPAEPFCMTYGDGVSDVNITALLDFHLQSGRLATVTAVEPSARFGAVVLADDRVASFREKPAGEGWVSGGFFVLAPKVLEYIAGDNATWEREPLERLAREGQLSAFRHVGFWQPMDTLRDRELLETLWQSGKAPWKSWKTE